MAAQLRNHLQKYDAGKLAQIKHYVYRRDYNETRLL